MDSVGGVRASFYLHIGQQPEEAHQAKVKLKHEIEAAETALCARGVFDDMIEAWLTPVRALIDDHAPLPMHAESIALFLAEDHCVMMSLPRRVQNSLTVSNRFFLKPLLPYLNDGGVIYLLLLDRSNTRMLRRGINELEPVVAPNMPKSVEETAAFDDPEKSLQRHGGEPRPREGRPGAQPDMPPHGQGAAKDKDSEQTARHNHQVAQAVSAFLAGEPKTLMVVGDEKNVGLFHQSARLDDHHVVNHYSNPSAYTRDDLWRLCAKTAEEIADQRLAESLERIQNLDPKRKIDDIQQTAIAASHGAIDTCVIASDVDVHGVVTPERNEVKILENDRGADCAHDLLDEAAQETIRHGGVAYAVDRDRLPDGALVVASRRYEMA